MKRLRHSVVHSETCEFHWGESCTCYDDDKFELQPEHIFVLIYLAVLVGLLVRNIH